VSPIDLDLFPHLEGVLDMIYNPARTQLLMEAANRGLITENGLWMLVAQAKEAAEWFLNKKLPDSLIQLVYDKMRQQMENIVLIGMPGCGKSTVGKLLAEQLGKTFVDADEELVKTYGQDIPAIFAAEGEAGFREKESAILTELGMRSGLIIATGGGCITRSENYAPLHQNGTIFWLQRDLENLPRDGRPLSQITKMEDMYRFRKLLYEAFADHIIGNHTTVEDTVAILHAKWEGNI
jgi:shikimate dehydrogenase